MSEQQVLLLHGVQSSRTTWWRVETDLEDLGVRVVALDLPGHGGRSATLPRSIPDLAGDVAAQLDDLAIERLDLIVGHSLGALVALALLQRQPRRARRLLLEDPPALGESLSATTVADELLTAVSRARRDRSGEIEARLAENPLWSRADAVSSVDNLLAMDADATAAMLRAAPAWDLAVLVRECVVPVGLLLARGPASATTEPSRSLLRKVLPAEDFVEVDSGHSVHRDRPGVWVATVLAALG